MKHKYLLFLMKYFSKYIPEDVLDKELRTSQNLLQELAGCDVLESDPSRVLPFNKYIFSSNEEYVADHIKLAKGHFLFVEYGAATYLGNNQITPYRTDLAITVALPYPTKKTTMLSDAEIDSGCLDLLLQVLDGIKADIYSFEGCEMDELFQFPCRIIKLHPNNFFNCVGFTAFFDAQEYE